MNKFALQMLSLAILATPVFADTATTQPVVIHLTASQLQAQVIDIAPKCVATTVGLVSRGSDPNMSTIGSGSGVIISADGLVMTAGHVIERPGNPLTIRFADGRVFQGVAVGLDHASDTGLARITDAAPAGGWAFAAIAPDNSAGVGEWVLATGNPGSIVLDRNPPLRLGRVTAHDANKLATNCCLEPGDSGGPVFDLNGRVVGINSRILTTRDLEAHQKEYFSMHVPVSLFTTEWKDLLAGENAHPEVVLGRRSGPNPGRGRNMLLRRAMNKLMAEKDPEAIKLMADAQASGGQMAMTPELQDHLIKKAGLAALATQPTTGMATLPATQPARLQAMSPATQPTTGPVEKGITAAMRPAISAQIRSKLQLQFPEGKITDELLNRIMDRSSFDKSTGKLNVVTNLQDLKDMGLSPDQISARASSASPGGRQAAAVGKTSLQTLALFAPSLQAAGNCVVEIRAAGQAVLLGTVVDSDGYIVTKASDLPDHAAVVLPDGRIMPAHVVGTDAVTDLALLKIPVTGLTSARFSDAAPLGEWLSAPTADPNAPAIGVVSDVARPIPEKFAHFAGEQKLVLGVGFSPASLVIAMISPGMSAEAAGLKIGDEVFQLNGTAVKDTADFMALMKKNKTGDTISIKVHREAQELEFKPMLGKVKATTQSINSVGEADNLAGGKLSKRRTNFPMAIQTDAAIWADQCGGPLVDLQGQVLGITVARYDRVCTFAIPANLVQKTIARLKGQPIAP